MWKRLGRGGHLAWKLIGSLSNSVFERRTSTGNGLFASQGSGLLASRHIKREKASLPVDVRHSKRSLLKLPNMSLVPAHPHWVGFCRVNLIKSGKLTSLCSC